MNRVLSLEGSCACWGVPARFSAGARIVDAESDAESDGYNYARLENPIVLEPNTEYVIASSETNGGDEYLSEGAANEPSTGTLWGTPIPTIQTAGGVWIIDRTGSNAGELRQPSGLFAPIVNLKIQ